MKTKINWLIFILVITTLVFSVTVVASMIIPANDRAKENSKSPESSPVIDENWELERVDFIHYAKPGNSGMPSKTETCYKLLGVKWKSLPVSYAINPSNPEGLDDSVVVSAVSTSAEAWDFYTTSELFNNTYTVNYTETYGVQNFVNAIDFGDYPDDTVIAVTSVWYNPRGREIVEFDMRFNTRFSWGDANPEKMDLQNIATHELGHSVGLDDIYSATCSAATMYGYSSYGETQKRTLELPDITGLQKMYGA